MNQTVHLNVLLKAVRLPAEQLTLFTLITLGVVESLINGVLSPTDAVRAFFHAENCLFVRKELKDRSAERIMSHGVQLPDLFETLSAEEAHREFQHELSTLRAMCLKLLEEKRSVA